MDSKKNIKINDDLLREILVHLPPKTLFKFMTVSKKWKYIINDPTFLKFHSNKQRRRSSAVAGDDGGHLLALFQLTTKHLSGRYRRRPSEPAMNILAVFPHGNPEIMCVEKELGYFINSSEGLVLCGRHSSKYHVMNPVTKKWVLLPPPPRHRLDQDQQYYRDWTIGLMVTAWEGDKSYIVVRAALTDDLDQQLPIETYSSKTGEWVPSMLFGTGEFVLHPLPGAPLVANGVFHWYTYNWQIALYDPSDETGHVQLIKIPYLDGAVSRAITRSSVDNTLWFGTINPDKIQIYKLPKGEKDGRMSYKRKKTIPCHEWELVHDIDIESLGVFFHVPDPEKNRMDRIRLECFVPNWYPLVLVLRQAEKIFLYNLGSNSVEWVSYYGCPYNHLVHEEYLCPYIESSCLSSYFV
ncbi:hypothetical protein MIMGU_mgv1a021348mg [Erythranthe guttata]|uniref:F-box domain-containing protein n=1 Tax=Erythranthe guttata TaxID=4155 RepID=A0A022RRJ0_ERYGU|nr:PREDICTED: F-box protein At5g03970-like [Erythranthe guttata]EYU43132.1 hypothetical protein MIMGU_mgv1a021348mg [Erythranthe guttata]|eukprot:XP_012830423.1 PREDICTED: F-box protein At5g03970-like [Erythranthe guttata]